MKQKTVVLDRCDAGTDSGITYDSLDADTQPREAVRKITLSSKSNGSAPVCRFAAQGHIQAEPFAPRAKR